MVVSLNNMVIGALNGVASVHSLDMGLEVASGHKLLLTHWTFVIDFA